MQVHGPVRTPSAIPHEKPQPAARFADRTYMYFPPVAKSISRITMDLTAGSLAPNPRLRLDRNLKQTFDRKSAYANWVYGSGYLATVISACLADFGTPVCCCHADGTSILEVAKGNIPFFRKESSGSNSAQRALGRLIYSADRRNWRARQR